MGSCSRRIRRCCPNLFLNFLSRFPLQPLAATSAVSRAPFGSARCSTLEGRGRFRGCLPLGLPATLLMAGSSSSIHASVALTGTIGTRFTFNATFADASMISRALASWPAASASRCTKSKSYSVSAASTTLIFLSNIEPRPPPGSLTVDRGMAKPTAAGAPQDTSNRSRCGTNARSEPPSQRKMNRIAVPDTTVKPTRMEDEVEHPRAAAGSPASSKYRGRNAHHRRGRASSPSMDNIERHEQVN